MTPGNEGEQEASHFAKERNYTVKHIWLLYIMLTFNPGGGGEKKRIKSTP